MIAVVMVNALSLSAFVALVGLVKIAIDKFVSWMIQLALAMVTVLVLHARATKDGKASYANLK